ncbi:MAG: hypothetical protein KF774_12065 [Planctomyces sp.]|nr:hypothetical protein [Planctomyces sp.]
MFDLRPLFVALLLAGSLAGCKQANDPEPPPNAPAGPEEPAQAAAPTQTGGLLERLTTTMVDKQQALADNPDLVVLEKNVFSVTDPITYAGKAYFSTVSQVQMAAIKQWVDGHEILNDRLPTFEEVDQMLKQQGIRLQGLYRWQKYGYDATDGSISILEDAEYKRSEREKAGLPPEE